MSAAQAVVSTMAVGAVLLLLRTYATARRDEREAQRESERAGRAEPPVLGNPKPRHPWRR